jgi:hypothetical protein
VVKIISPFLRCHHISGSSKRDLTVNTARAQRRQQSMEGNENTRCRILTGMVAAFSGAIADSVLRR